jgi:hypothetical protein
LTARTLGATIAIDGRSGAMPSDHEKPYDFYLSFNDSVESAASEVKGILERYRVYLRLPMMTDWRPPGRILEDPEQTAANRKAIKNSRDLIILYSKDYEASNFEDFLTFIGPREKGEQHRIIILRCENVPVKGLLASYPCEDLAGIENSEERRRRILRACGPLCRSHGCISRSRRPPFARIAPPTSFFLSAM